MATFLATKTVTSKKLWEKHFNSNDLTFPRTLWPVTCILCESQVQRVNQNRSLTLLVSRPKMSMISNTAVWTPSWRFAEQVRRVQERPAGQLYQETTGRDSQSGGASLHTGRYNAHVKICGAKICYDLHQVTQSLFKIMELWQCVDISMERDLPLYVKAPHKLRDNVVYEGV